MFLRYRKDIGCLRAVAVLSVVLYHFNIPFLVGGFSGVDVFFVLSGFLMSSIYYERITFNYQTVLSFYSSRIKRLYPALCFMCILSVASLYILMPEFTVFNFVNEAKRALSFTSNLLFAERSSYFDKASDSYWLLHTWSLSIEFQFYILFPFIVLLSKSIKIKNSALFVYSFIASISLLYCVYSSSFAGKDTFYVLSTRMWELLAGSIASIIKLDIKREKRKALSISGLLLVLFSVVFFKESESWPNYLTLVPILGAVLCIISCNSDNYDFKYNRAIRFFADISYSWYLSHWLVVAFMKNKGIEMNAVNISCGLLTSLFIALLSWKLIEKPFGASVKRIFALAMMAFVVVLPSDYFLSKSLGEISKYTDYGSSDSLKVQFHIQCFVQGDAFNINDFINSGCQSIDKNKKTVLLIGDSHAAQLSMEIRRQLSSYNILQFTASGCFPYEKSKKESKNACSKLMGYLFDSFLPNNHIDYAIVSAHMIVYAGDNIEGRVRTLSADLKKYTKNVYAIGQTKVFPEPFVRTALSNRKEDICGKQRADVVGFNVWLKQMYERSFVSYIDVLSFDESDGICGLSSDGTPLFFDTNHLTPMGARLIVSEVKKQADL